MTPGDTRARAAQALQALEEGRVAEAEATGRELIKTHPRQAVGWAVLAEALARTPERHDQAQAAYLRALDLQPRWNDLRAKWADFLLQREELGDAILQARTVLQAVPLNAPARLTLAEAALRLGREDEACAELETLTASHPGFAGGWIQLSWLRLRRREVDAALHCTHLAIAADARSGLAHSRLAEALCASGRSDEASPHFDRAVALSPGLRSTFSKRLLALSYCSQVPAEELVHAHKVEGARLADQASPGLPPPGRWSAKARIRVGYVSSDFVGHAVSFFFTPALLAHDRRKVALYAYYSQPLRQDDRPAISGRFDHWRNCAGWSDADLARQIRADDIDVLIDLSGHTAHNRLGVFARKPARVHWQWFGYPMLTGLSAFDARLTDRWLDPSDPNPAGERLLRLPSRLAWAPGAAYPPVAGTPCLAGRPFTFGSFNGLRKMNRPLLESWAAILAGVPGSRLRMGHMDSASFEHGLRAMLQGAGVDPGRLEVLPTMSMSDYLAAHADIDLLLDSFPYNGGTTTMMGVWQGTPVLSRAGCYGVQRLGASLLLQLGLEELVVDGQEQYVARAIALARQPDKLQSWRASLRERILSAPLGRPRTVVTQLESLMAQALATPA